ncbi:hypothetical protein A5633_08395 [Mycolicibacterium elephantis]|uniref:Uncharacterized protein n=1 Tax=Mycolicibacterium elephantis DSM 44368 TaxID=1335622 RepID=A0A439DPP0_9MYCO|nr:hypothetical protein A5633_08395 [Mycolicibacterium elephantis]RWA17587.1 hypothetical protein MELE44368_05425 [Mycolicibacterium elephantis DSM 44368]
MKLKSLDDGNLVVELTATFTHKLIGIEISMQGLYEIDPKSPALLSKDDTDGILARIPDDYRSGIANHAANDLFPFLRQSLHTTSIQLDPQSPMLLAPTGQWDVLMRDDPNSETSPEPK